LSETVESVGLSKPVFSEVHRMHPFLFPGLQSFASGCCYFSSHIVAYADCLTFMGLFGPMPYPPQSGGR